MELNQIQKKVRFVNNSKGKPVEVILPYDAYREYMEIKISLELYKSLEVQESIKRAKNDLATGKFKDYENIEQLLKDLHG